MTQGERQRLRSDEEVVKELCMANGVFYEKIAQEGSNVNSLEIFLSGFPRMVGLSFFPRLCQLTIVGQDVKDIEGLECCPLLQELWVAQCHLTEISGLENCLQLKKLYLYENQISEIKNLDWQTNVEVLWLNNNRITQIQGLNTLKNLKELNLADNSIKRIGHCLDPNVNLQNLNLSGNKINSFKELTMLAHLPHLGELTLNDPMSTPNPVCLLYNYPTHVLYHMPGLQHLDTYDVSGAHLKEAAEFTVMKKIMYYNMRVHSAQRSLAEIRFSLLEKKKTLLQIPEECIRTLSHNLKNLERELCMRSACSYEDVPAHAGDGLTDSNGPPADIIWDPTMEYKILRKIEALRDRLAQWTKKLSEIEAWYERDLAQATRMMDYTIQFLLVELEGVGNIRLEEGSPTDLWFTTCYDLLLSRFSHSEYKSHGIIGIKMTRVIRIHNRALQLRFEERLQNLLSNEEYVVLSQSSKRRFDHLFYIGDPGKNGEKEEILSIVENGFKSPEEYKASGREGAVPLTNSLFASDQLRIEHAVQQAKHNATKSKLNSIPFRHGQIIISKVFIGHSTPIRHGVLVERSNFPRNFSVYRNVHRSGLSDERSRSSKSHSGSEGSPKRRNWLVFDHELVQPEYIVYFEYITGDQEYPPLLDRKTDRYDHSANEVILDKEVLNMEPQLKQHPKLLSLTEKTLLHVAKANVLSQITMLNLHSNSLSRIKEISSLTALRHLTISFNEFTHLEDISHLPHLEYLDASYNRLATLEGLKGLGQLKHLDVRWNKLTNIREDTSVLKKHTPALLRLDTRFNPWNKPETVRMNILGCMTKLTHLDEGLIEEEEAADAVQMVASSKINQTSLLTHSRTSNERPRRLSLLSTAQLLHLLTPAAWGLARQLEPDWTEKITALNLDNQRISKLANLNKLVNLRWASFNDNVISKVEGLDCCSKLEELFLNNNCISALSGFSKLLCLTKLSMDGNQLSVLDSSVLDQLPNMTFLSVENNCITSLTGIEKARSLLELYIGNNQITTSRDIYYLKGLTNLIILDLYGNPLVGRLEASYRIYVVFHLPSLKALDGVAVEANECENAKDMFEGRLTSDMLAEKLGHSNYADITYLTLQCCSIRTVDLSPTDLFSSLRSINLDHNNLTSFSGLVYLPNVKALCLNNNHIKSILPRQKTQTTSKETLYSKVHSSGYGQQNASKVTRDAGGTGCLEPLMGSLEVLHLSHNGISNMANLQLSRLPNLKALFLQGNEISQVEGLEGLHQLRQLVLNRNRIKALTKSSFTSQSVLLELHLAENRIRDLSHLCPLTELRKLYLGMNKLQDVAELDKLEVLPSLTELSVVGNPLARTSLHRPAVVLRLSQLQILDGVTVTIEERTRAELLSGETSICSQCPGAALAAEINLPGFLPLMPHNIPLRGMSISGLQNFTPAHNIFPHSVDDVQSQYSYKDKKLRHSNAPRSCQTDMTFRHYRRTGDSLPSTGLFSDVNRVIITYPSQEQDSRLPNDGKPPHL